MNKVLTIDSYESFIDGKYIVGQEIPKGQVIFVNPEDIKEFMNALPWDRKVVVVSAESDYGIHYQLESHPNRDVAKHIPLIDVNQIEQSVAYVDVIINTRAADKCDCRDRYSCKIDRYTINTFNEIDNNIVAWFCTNANIDEKNVHFYPFGMNKQGHGKDIIQSYYKPFVQKKDAIYCNFRVNTPERLYLEQYCKHIHDGQNIITQTEPISIEKYYTELAACKYVLCPTSNGLDSYRIYETLLVGSIPIVPTCRWSRKLLREGFNVFLADNLFNLNKTAVSTLNQSATENWNTKLLEPEYWGEKINKARKML